MITSHDPSSPMDVEVDVTASATADATVAPKFASGADTFTFFGCDSVIVRP